MNLVLDFGNSLYKLATFSNNEIVAYEEFEYLDAQTLRKWVGDMKKYSGAIISSVRNYDSEIDRFLEQHFPLIKLNQETPIPIVNKYGSKNTLGKDRIALAVAGRFVFPDKDVLVIDAGTCITYDFVTASGEYLGGGISPGMQTRFRALATFTDHLPLLTYKENVSLIGSNTEESMLTGVINGTIAEIDGIITQYREKFPGIMVIISGGEAIYFDKRLKNNIFAFPNLVLKGLNLILKYNFEKK